MRIASIGGGPAGLYFAILMKKLRPEAEVEVFERNRSDDTFGWGVVFSHETLGGFREADPESYDAIAREFAYWDDIETHVRGAVTRSTGHGFCGLARRRLLQILQGRCKELGVALRFEHEVPDPAELGDRDLVLGADGVNSMVRARWAEDFRPSIDERPCRFAWLGTTLPLEAFTFHFAENEHGLFQVHAYPFQRAPEVLSTWIVETHADTWRRAGLDRASEEETVAYCEALFREVLGGHRLLANRSLWRSFPTIRCERWSRGNLVLLGDAAHTAHFSIGSGTKLAMEDAVVLVESFARLGTDDVPAVLADYEERRRPDVIRLQRAAQTSLEWFENSRRYLDQPPLQFTFNLMTRSKRITWDNLRRRDPVLIDDVARWWNASRGRPEAGTTPPLFAPLRLRGLELGNRIVVSPMCQYSARDGVVGDWHLVHLGSRAVGGAGLVMTEMTDVSAAGRITLGCAGLWNHEQEEAWGRVVEFVHAQSASKIGLQLAHAGRKGSCNLPWEGDDPLRDHTAWETVAPSALPFAPGWPTPRAMERADLERVREDFVAAARRADGAGFDLLELHMAHGYLLSSFLSPLSNERRDAFGGDLAGRMAYPLEVFEAVRAVWPAQKPLAVRLTASDWLPGEGMTPEDALAVARALCAAGCDLIDVSSGGNTPRSRPDYGRMYQVPFAERIRAEAGLPVMAVGAILSADHANTILAAGRADLCALARTHLIDPYVTLGAAVDQGVPGAVPWPRQYLPARSLPPRRDA